MLRLLVASLLVLPGSALATTFVVPTDAELMAEADVIVAGVVVSGEVRTTHTGDLVTVTRVVIEESLKGNAPPVVDVVEEGGVFGARGVWVHGIPQYEPGERVLLFLTRLADSRFRTTRMLLGKFVFDGGELTRGSAEHGVFGLDASGELHVEGSRDANEFLDSLRDNAGAGFSRPVERNVVRTRRLQPAPTSHISATAYAMSPPARWNNGASATFVSNANSGAVSRALAAWTGDAGSSINYTFGGVAVEPYAAGDGRNSVIFNIPRSQFGGVIALASTTTDGTHVYGGASWRTVVEGDVRLSDSVNSFSAATVDAIVAHELGHTLGLRHADFGSPNAGSALMTSVIGNNRGAVLGDWDRDAVSHLYGSGVTTCKPVTISGGPSASPSVILTGEFATLSVSADGELPLTYQWYMGNPGDTFVSVGSSRSVQVSPTAAWSYWVRIRNACGIAVDSPAVQVLVADAPPCIPARIRTQPSDVVIRSGEAAQLILGMDGSEPFTYTWYEGFAGDTSRPLGRNLRFLSVAPAITSNYWVRVRNACGSPDDSRTATVTVLTPNGSSPRNRTIRRR